MLTKKNKLLNKIKKTNRKRKNVKITLDSQK